MSRSGLQMVPLGAGQPVTALLAGRQWRGSVLSGIKEPQRSWFGRRVVCRIAAGGTSGSMPSALKRAARSSTHCGGVRWSFSGMPGFAVPQRVAEGLAQMPGHEPVGRQLPSGGLLVVAHDRGQQLQAGTHPGTGEGAQLVLGLGSSGGREVHHQPELVTVPHLVVAVKVAVHEHGRARRGETASAQSHQRMTVRR